MPGMTHFSARAVRLLRCADPQATSFSATAATVTCTQCKAKLAAQTTPSPSREDQQGQHALSSSAPKSRTPSCHRAPGRRSRVHDHPARAPAAEPRRGEEFESIVRDGGATPATIAVLDGIPHGLDEEGVRRIADEDIAKASVRDLPILAAVRRSGATTVAATAHIAAAAGIRVFATGGLGGACTAGRPRPSTSPRTSPPHLLTPVAVVCAGSSRCSTSRRPSSGWKTLSVPVLGYRTDEFPAFWLRSSGYVLDWRLDSPAEVMAVLRAQDAGTSRADSSSPTRSRRESLQWRPAEHDRVLAESRSPRPKRGRRARGKAVTQFLLGDIVQRSSGRSLEVNLDLVRNNIRVATEISNT